MNSCALVSAGQSGPRHSMAPAAWEAVRRGLPPAHWQRYSTVSCLPLPWMRGPAGHTQPCHAHLSSLQGSLAMVCQHLDSHQPAAASTLHADLLFADDRRGPWQPSAELASLWQRLRLLAITQLWAAYCTARLRPDRQMTPAHIAARGLSGSQRPDAPRLAPDWVRHQAQGRGAQPLAQGEAAQHDSGAIPTALDLGSYSSLSAAIVSSYPLCISQCGQLCTLHRLPNRLLLIPFRIGRLAWHRHVAPCFPH